MAPLENLGLKVRKKRGDQGVRAAAKEIGISHATLSRVERGFLPDLENYQKICRWLGEAPDVIPPTAAKSKSSIPQVHFRKQPTVSAETAKALAQLILTAQAVISSQNS
jgi:transcriptional regulator with XRE-family HTH domain